ncbi:hypothetical protein MBLNU13_g10939t2 [Cladosporium sp. NU13]
MTTKILKLKLTDLSYSGIDTAETTKYPSIAYIWMVYRSAPIRSTRDTLFNMMARHESSEFKNAADKAAYESYYAERNVRHNVHIAGFRHSHQEKSTRASRGRNISSAALAGYCGHFYTIELRDWLCAKRVIMVFEAFRMIEKARFNTSVIDIPHLKAKHVWAQLNNPQNVAQIKKQSIEISVGDLEPITDQTGIQAFISKLPDFCSRAQGAVDDAEGLTKTMKNARKKEISYVAMGIQLARFQQVLLYTSNGQRFFSGKAGLAGNPGCKVFEGAIEIEDLSRAVELFAFAKIRTEYKRNAEGERLNKAKDVLAEKPYFYSPSVITDRDAAKAAATCGTLPAAPVHHTRTIHMINTTENETLDATPGSRPMTPASRSGIEAEDSTHGASTLSGIGQVRKHSARSHKPTGKLEVAYEDLHMLWKNQAGIEEGKTKAKQKQKDIKKKVSSIKQARRIDDNKLRGWEEKLEKLRQTVKGHEDDLEGLAEQYQQATKELKDLERGANMLVSDFDLAVIKRKGDELEQDEERIKKQNQALIEEH